MRPPKGTHFFVCSENFVFRTDSRSEPRFRSNLPMAARALRAHLPSVCIKTEIHGPGHLLLAFGQFTLCSRFLWKLRLTAISYFDTRCARFCDTNRSKGCENAPFCIGISIGTVVSIERRSVSRSYDRRCAPPCASRARPCSPRAARCAAPRGSSSPPPPSSRPPRPRPHRSQCPK